MRRTGKRFETQSPPREDANGLLNSVRMTAGSDRLTPTLLRRDCKAVAGWKRSPGLCSICWSRRCWPALQLAFREAAQVMGNRIRLKPSSLLGPSSTPPILVIPLAPSGTW